jgi:hypothetical protein
MFIELTGHKIPATAGVDISRIALVESKIALRGSAVCSTSLGYKRSAPSEH